MDDRRLGAAVRARRHQRGWRLVDLAAAAGVGAGVCGLLERGQVVRLSVRTARAIVEAVDLPLGWDIGWQRQEVERLVDADHSALAASVAASLEAAGWSVRSEVSFNHFGERGRIDLLASHRPDSSWWSRSRRRSWMPRPCSAASTPRRGSPRRSSMTSAGSARWAWSRPS